jgi:hypothetical protein
MASPNSANGRMNRNANFNIPAREVNLTKVDTNLNSEKFLISNIMGIPNDRIKLTPNMEHILQIYTICLPMLRILAGAGAIYVPNPEFLFNLYTEDEITTLLTIVFKTYNNVFADVIIIETDDTLLAYRTMLVFASLSQYDFEEYLMDNSDISESKRGGGNQPKNYFKELFENEYSQNQKGGMPRRHNGSNNESNSGSNSGSNNESTTDLGRSNAAGGGSASALGRRGISHAASSGRIVSVNSQGQLTRAAIHESKAANDRLIAASIARGTARTRAVARRDERVASIIDVLTELDIPNQIRATLINPKKLETAIEAILTDLRNKFTNTHYRFSDQYNIKKKNGTKIKDVSIFEISELIRKLKLDPKGTYYTSSRQDVGRTQPYSNATWVNVGGALASTGIGAGLWKYFSSSPPTNLKPNTTGYPTHTIRTVDGQNITINETDLYAPPNYSLDEIHPPVAFDYRTITLKPGAGREVKIGDTSLVPEWISGEKSVKIYSLDQTKEQQSVQQQATAYIGYLEGQKAKIQKLLDEVNATITRIDCTNEGALKAAGAAVGRSVAATARAAKTFALGNDHTDLSFLNEKSSPSTTKCIPRVLKGEQKELADKERQRLEGLKTTYETQIANIDTEIDSNRHAVSITLVKEPNSGTILLRKKNLQITNPCGIGTAYSYLEGCKVKEYPGKPYLQWNPVDGSWKPEFSRLKSSESTTSKITTTRVSCLERNDSFQGNASLAAIVAGAGLAIHDYGKTKSLTARGAALMALGIVAMPGIGTCTSAGLAVGTAALGGVLALGAGIAGLGVAGYLGVKEYQERVERERRNEIIGSAETILEDYTQNKLKQKLQEIFLDNIRTNIASLSDPAYSLFMDHISNLLDANDTELIDEIQSNTTNTNRKKEAKTQLINSIVITIINEYLKYHAKPYKKYLIEEIGKRHSEQYINYFTAQNAATLITAQTILGDMINDSAAQKAFADLINLDPSLLGALTPPTFNATGEISSAIRSLVSKSTKTAAFTASAASRIFAKIQSALPVQQEQTIAYPATGGGGAATAFAAAQPLALPAPLTFQDYRNLLTDDEYSAAVAAVAAALGAPVPALNDYEIQAVVGAVRQARAIGLNTEQAAGEAAAAITRLLVYVPNPTTDNINTSVRNAIAAVARAAAPGSGVSATAAGIGLAPGTPPGQGAPVAPAAAAASGAPGTASRAPLALPAHSPVVRSPSSAALRAAANAAAAAAAAAVPAPGSASGTGTPPAAARTASSQARVATAAAPAVIPAASGSAAASGAPAAAAARSASSGSPAPGGGGIPAFCPDAAAGGRRCKTHKRRHHTKLRRHAKTHRRSKTHKRAKPHRRAKTHRRVKQQRGRKY